MYSVNRPILSSSLSRFTRVVETHIRGKNEHPMIFQLSRVLLERQKQGSPIYLLCPLSDALHCSTKSARDIALLRLGTKFRVCL